MSDFFDTLQDAVLVAGRGIESTAKDLTARAKLQYEIKTREGYLSELYQELGKTYYAKHKDDEEKDESIAEVEKLLGELGRLRSEYMDMKGAKTCPHCGAQADKEADYCGKCGKPLFEDEPAE